MRLCRKRRQRRCDSVAVRIRREEVPELHAGTPGDNGHSSPPDQKNGLLATDSSLFSVTRSTGGSRGTVQSWFCRILCEGLRQILCQRILCQKTVYAEFSRTERRASGMPRRTSSCRR